MTDQRPRAAEGPPHSQAASQMDGTEGIEAVHGKDGWWPIVASISKKAGIAPHPQVSSDKHARRRVAPRQGAEEAPPPSLTQPRQDGATW